MKEKHTPGPWFQEKTFGESREVIGKRMAVLHTCVGENHHIRSEKALAHLQMLHPLTGDEDFAYLEQAIAKAKGES